MTAEAALPTMAAPALTTLLSRLPPGAAIRIARVNIPLSVDRRFPPDAG